MASTLCVFALARQRHFPCIRLYLSREQVEEMNIKELWPRLPQPDTFCAARFRLQSVLFCFWPSACKGIWHNGMWVWIYAPLLCPWQPTYHPSWSHPMLILFYCLFWQQVPSQQLILISDLPLPFCILKWAHVSRTTGVLIKFVTHFKVESELESCCTIESLFLLFQCLN